MKRNSHQRHAYLLAQAIQMLEPYTQEPDRRTFHELAHQLIGFFMALTLALIIKGGQ